MNQKKTTLTVVWVLLFLATFLIYFIVSYKNFRRIKKSARIAMMLAIALSFSKPANAGSSGLPGANGFTPLPPAYSQSVGQGSGLFDQSKTANQDPGDDKPNPGGGVQGEMMIMIMSRTPDLNASMMMNTRICKSQLQYLILKVKVHQTNQIRIKIFT